VHDIAVPEHGRNWPEPIDERLAFLLRAAVRYELLASGDLAVDEAFDELIDEFLWIIFPLPENPAEAHWDAPSWREAAAEYHRNRKLGGW
jgi:hypothetical protein